jgi:hypothetical protein
MDLITGIDLCSMLPPPLCDRSFGLPDDARPDAIHAHIDNGVLTIDM